MRPGAESALIMKEYVPEWANDRLIVLCLGNGLQMDGDLLNILNGAGAYVLLAESLPRSVKANGDAKISVADLLSSMEYIVASSAGIAAKDLASVLPSFDYEKVTNKLDFSLHRHGGSPYTERMHYTNSGCGIHLGQSRTEETKPVLTEGDLQFLQKENKMLACNVRGAGICTARIVH